MEQVDSRPGLIGEAARSLDALPWADRARVDRKTVGKAVFMLLAFAVLLWAAMRTYEAGPGAGSSTALTFLPFIFLLAFLFETLDSGAGMGFGTALSPLLLLYGFEPLAVVPVLLVSEAVTGLVAGVFHHEFRNVDFTARRHENVALRVVVLVTLLGMLGAMASVVLGYFALSLPGGFVRGYVGILVLAFGLMALARCRPKAATSYRPGKLVAFALIAGVNKGIGGGGYGPVVTMGTILSGVHEKCAAAITSLSEGVVSLAGLTAFLAISTAGVAMDFSLLPSVIAGSFIAAIFGPYLVRVIPTRVYRLVIPVYGIAIGIATLGGMASA